MLKIHRLTVSGESSGQTAVMQTLLNNYIIADKSQTAFYRSTLRSLKYTISTGDNISEIKDKCSNEITELYETYGFTDVIPTIDIWTDKIYIKIEASLNGVNREVFIEQTI